MRRIFALAVVLIGITTLAVWTYNRFVMPVLPPVLSSNAILFSSIFVSIVGILAAFKDVLELTQLFSDTSTDNIGAEPDINEGLQNTHNTYSGNDMQPVNIGTNEGLLIQKSQLWLDVENTTEWEKHYALALHWDKQTRFRGFNLENRDLSGLDFSNADFRKANLKGADLSNAILISADLSGANLEGAKLEYADMRRSKLLDTYFKYATLNNSRFDEANIEDAKFIEATARECEFSNALMVHAYIRDSDFRGAKFQNCNLERIKLMKSKFMECDFKGSNLLQSYIKSSDFSHAILRDTQIREGKIIDCEFNNCDLTNANLTKTYRENSDLSSAIITDIIFDDRTSEFEITKQSVLVNIRSLDGGGAMIPVDILTIDSLRNIALQIHSDGETWQDEIMGWPASYSVSQGSTGCFKIGVPNIWFYSLTWQENVAEPLEIIDESNVAKLWAT